MFVFGIGALLVAGWLGWMTWQEYRAHPPVNLTDKLGFLGLAAGGACIVALAVWSFVQ